MKILVSGATGYVGSKLVPRLVSSGHEVACMARDASRIPANIASVTRVVVADALEPESLSAAMRGIEVAYYLIHSMSASSMGDFRRRDYQAAENFATAARQAGVDRIIFLGGLASETSEMSAHLKSRHETGEALRKFGPPVTEFRAGIIVGNGSFSFELIRYLTERLPVMICPRWVITRTQPIAIDDVLQYLIDALNVRESADQVVEIGGASIETYRGMMLTYARARGLRRWLIRIPLLTPRLSSYWLRLVTPIPTEVARPLIEGLRTEVVCRSQRAAELFPEIRPMGYAAAIEKTLARDLPDDSLIATVSADQTHVLLRREGVLCDVHQAVTDARPEEVFSVLQRLGGASGYLYANGLWRMRGWLDRCVGGVGMKKSAGCGILETDHCVDFWYVQQADLGRRLLLQAKMKLPGRAWLEFLLKPQRDGRTLVRCCAWFEPRGLWGELYWWILYPFHILIFRGMLRAVCERAVTAVGSLADAPQVR